MAYTVMAHIVMAYIGMAYVVMAYLVVMVLARVHDLVVRRQQQPRAKPLARKPLDICVVGGDENGEVAGGPWAAFSLAVLVFFFAFLSSPAVAEETLETQSKICRSSPASERLRRTAVPRRCRPVVLSGVLSCMRACCRACMRACCRACCRACMRACCRVCCRACVRANMHVRMRACKLMCVRACSCSCVRACVRWGPSRSTLVMAY